MIWYYWTFDLWSLIWNPSSSQKQSGVVLEIEIEGFIKNITWIDNIPLLKKWFQLFLFKYLLNICRHIFRYPLHPNLYKYLYFKNGLSKSVRKVGNSPCIMEKNVDLFFQKVLYSKFIKSGRCILAKSCVYWDLSFMLKILIMNKYVFFLVAQSVEKLGPIFSFCKFSPSY